MDLTIVLDPGGCSQSQLIQCQHTYLGTLALVPSLDSFVSSVSVMRAGRQAAERRR
jgi:hypothetical protein